MMNLLVPSLCAAWILACSPGNEKGKPETSASVQPQSVVQVPASEGKPVAIQDARVYRMVVDNGKQGRDTFLLEKGTYKHINWNGVGQKWYLESTVIDTAANGIWIMSTKGYDYTRRPIDRRDSLQVRRFDKEAIVYQWQGNRPDGGRRIPRLK